MTQETMLKKLIALSQKAIESWERGNVNASDRRAMAGQAAEMQAYLNEMQGKVGPVVETSA